MKIVVCDDALVYEQMKNIIASYSIVKNENLELTFYQTVEELLHAKHKYDILFLDIRFNNCDIGIDVAKKLRKAGNTSLIILLTSLHSKAIEGYEIGAYRYIVKPIIKEKMYAVLDEAISSIHSNYRVILVKDMYNTVVVKIQQMYNIDKPQERRKATGTGGIPPENIRLRRTLTTEYLQLSLCYGVRDRMSIETAGFTGWR